MIAMSRRQTLLAAALVVLAPSLTWGAGFALFEHGNRAMAMGGAFTGLADDPSALYWNPAGTAFQLDEGVQVMVGVTFITANQHFYGDSPYPGDGYEASQKDQTFFPPHFYLVYPLSDRFAVNVAFMTPFGLGTWWEEDHAGRFISKRADLKLYDLTPSIAYKINDSIGISVGFDYGIGQVDLTRNIGQLNPYTQQLADIGQVHLHTDDMSNDGWGWNASLHAKLAHGFSVGATYRSAIKVDYDGVASFTQYPTGYPDFDAVVATVVPFGQKTPLKTKIEFPEYWVVGVAWSHEQWTVTGSYGAQGWSSFQSLPITFTQHPELSSSVEENYKDSDQFRFGLEYRASDTWAFQGGFLLDKTPQPKGSMSPLLGDADRTGVSLGFSWTRGTIQTDVGYMFLMFDERGTDRTSYDVYEGRYDTQANLLGASVTFRF